MTPGAWILLASLLLAVAFGAWRAYADGRFRGTHTIRGFERGAGRPPQPPVSPVVEDGADAPESPVVEEGRQGPSRNHQDPAATTQVLEPEQLGDRATLLQFSSAFCAPCRATRRILADVADTVPGVAHVEIDAEHHLDLVRRVAVRRTPTTLVLDADGREVTRAAGAPRKEQVLAALALTERPHDGSASQESGRTGE